MMNNDKAFLDFYTDLSDEDPEYIHNYLIKEGIDVDGLRARLLDLIAKRKAELEAAEKDACKPASEEPKSGAGKIVGVIAEAPSREKDAPGGSAP